MSNSPINVANVPSTAIIGVSTLYKVVFCIAILISFSPIAQAESFQRPQGLENAVLFWRAIFSQYNSDTIILHDSIHLERIYESFPAERRAPVIVERQAAIEERLRRLSTGGASRNAADRTLLSLFSFPLSGRLNRSQRTTLKNAAKTVRIQRGHGDHFREGIIRSKQWMASIITALKEAGVPTELRALPFVESSFQPDVYSVAGAAGLWQLMPATAKELGLKVSRSKRYKHKDERLNVTKATFAAAKMLRKNFEMLGNWPLAITGYNHGPYGIRRAAKKHKTKDLMVLIKHYRKSSWGFASKNFYAEFVAALELLKEHEQSLKKDS